MMHSTLNFEANDEVEHTAGEDEFAGTIYDRMLTLLERKSGAAQDLQVKGEFDIEIHDVEAVSKAEAGEDEDEEQEESEDEVEQEEAEEEGEEQKEGQEGKEEQEQQQLEEGQKGDEGEGTSELVEEVVQPLTSRAQDDIVGKAIAVEQENLAQLVELQKRVAAVARELRKTSLDEISDAEREGLRQRLGLRLNAVQGRLAAQGVFIGTQRNWEQELADLGALVRAEAEKKSSVPRQISRKRIDAILERGYGRKGTNLPSLDELASPLPVAEPSLSERDRVQEAWAERKPVHDREESLSSSSSSSLSSAAANLIVQNYSANLDNAEATEPLLEEINSLKEALSISEQKRQEAVRASLAAIDEAILARRVKSAIARKREENEVRRMEEEERRLEKKKREEQRRLEKERRLAERAGISSSGKGLFRMSSSLSSTKKKKGEKKRGSRRKRRVKEGEEEGGGGGKDGLRQGVEETKAEEEDASKENGEPTELENTKPPPSLEPVNTEESQAWALRLKNLF